VEEGILIGGSGGTAVAAALRVAENLTDQDLVVVLIPDSGRGYLSKVFDKSWMINMGFSRYEGSTVSDVLDRITGGEPNLIYVRPETKVGDALEIMRQHDLPVIPVASGEMPIAAAEVMGSVSEDSLTEQSFDADGSLNQRVDEVMGPHLPMVGIGESLEIAVNELQNSPVLLVLDNGQPRSLLTESDLKGSDIGEHDREVS
ncbi:MAG: CBS domain-containing protein, partial [Actinomycetota bacterium]|nr:CBS domain-containing protein [Actinomycetota bacterium]